MNCKELNEKEMQDVVGGVAPTSFGKPMSNTQLTDVQGEGFAGAAVGAAVGAVAGAVIGAIGAGIDGATGHKKQAFGTFKQGVATGASAGAGIGALSPF